MSYLKTVTVCALALACAPRAVAGPYDDLLKHATANTNALVLIDVNRATNSPLAKNEKWAEKLQQSGYGGLGFFPPDAELVAVAAEVNLTSMVRDFQVGLVKVKNMPNFKELAAHESGALDDIAGQLTVVSARNVYFTNFPGSTLAVAYPADRQYVARWLKADNADKQPGLSPQLRAAADAAADNAVTIALDLEDVVDASALKFGLGYSPVMAKNPNVNTNALSVFIARTKALTFEAKVTSRVDATLTVLFSDEASRYKAVLKDLFLELIDGYGVYIPGLDLWEAKFVGNSMILSGTMTSNDLKRVVSLFAFPNPDQPDPAEAPMPDEPTAAATKRYLAAVGALLDGLKNTKDDATSHAKTATWQEKTAAQLEQLGRRNVDPLAVDVAYQAARSLRSIAASLRGVPIDTNALAQKAYVSSQRSPYYGWGPYGGGGWWGGYRQLAFAPREYQTNVPQVQGEIAKVIADDQKKRIATWTALDQLMVDTKRKLGDKYKTKF
jgi:hypothetical protein